MNTSKLSHEDILKALMANLEDSYDLVFVDYDDCLTSQQVKYMIVDDWESLFEDLNEWESDSREYGFDYVLRDALDQVRKDLDPEEWDEDSISEAMDTFHLSQEHETFREAVLDRDSGRWFEQLVNQTSNIYVRIPLNASSDGVYVPYDSNAEEGTLCKEFAQKMDALLIPQIGMSIHDTLVRWAEDYGACDYWYQPWVFGTLNLSDLRFVPSDSDVTVTGGTILIWDSTSGAGAELDLPEELSLSVTVPRDALIPDVGGWGYGFEDGCGLVRGLWPLTVAKANQPTCLTLSRICDILDTSSEKTTS